MPKHREKGIGPEIDVAVRSVNLALSVGLDMLHRQPRGISRPSRHGIDVVTKSYSEPSRKVIAVAKHRIRDRCPIPAIDKVIPGPVGYGVVSR